MSDLRKKSDEFFEELADFLNSVTADGPGYSAEFSGQATSEANLRQLIWHPAHYGVTQSENKASNSRDLYYYGGMLRIPKSTDEYERREQQIEYLRSFVNEDGSVRELAGAEFVPDGQGEVYEALDTQTGDFLLFVRLPYRQKS